GRAPARVAYSRSTSGVSRAGSTLKETSRTPSRSRCRRGEGGVSAGETAGQRGETKNAVHTGAAGASAPGGSPPRPGQAEDVAGEILGTERFAAALGQGEGRDGAEHRKGATVAPGKGRQEEGDAEGCAGPVRRVSDALRPPQRPAWRG